ncbi:MAG: ATP-grasp domain-containing protein [Promethearchaeota archaeon]
MGENLIKIGIIIDNYHLNYKVTEFLKYLKSIAEVKLYVEESYIFSSNDIKCDEDVFFVKGKRPLILGLVKFIEELTSIPVINSYKAIWLAINRFLNSTYLRKAGIPVPDFSLNPEGILPPFKDYIIKNIIDQKNYKFKPVIKKQKDHLVVADERALNEVSGKEEQYKYLYYQKFIKSEWEYKIYGIGEEVYFYKQKPILVNPNKLESRHEIHEITELKEYCLKAMDIMDLKITSLDFQKSIDNEFFLTDINSTPNFNYIKDGHKIVANYLIDYAKK